MSHPKRDQIVSKPIAFFALLLAAAITGLLAAVPANAHTLGQSYVFANIEERQISGHLELPADQLLLALGLTEPTDKAALAELLNNEWPRIETYLRSHFTIAQNGTGYALQFAERDSLEIEIAYFLLVNFVAIAPGAIADKVDFHYSAIMHTVPDHRGGLVVESNVKTGLKGNHRELSFFFAPGREDFTLNTLGESALANLFQFVREGMVHIWIGYDHILFLVTLLLASVVIVTGGDFKPADKLRPAMINLITVVTLFTVAHSITLALAMKGWVTVPPRMVESMIALSVVVVALNNIYPFMRKYVWLLIFGFGLFHGLGFASVLMELAVNRQSRIMGLIGFNVGVEIGQLAIVIVIFPILYLLRHQPWYNFLVLKVGSALIALVGGWWLFTRAFNL
ncbi:MAG: HupE/UreJ family protein [Pseudomonadales bacterium]